MTARKNAKAARAARNRSEKAKAFLEFRVFMGKELGHKVFKEKPLEADTSMTTFNAVVGAMTAEKKVATIVSQIGKTGFFQTKKDYVAARVAFVLYGGEGELNATHRDRALAAIARKGWSEKDPASNARRTKAEHDAIRSAERHWTRFLDEHKIENLEARGGHNKGKKKPGAKQDAQKGKAKGEPAAPAQIVTVLDVPRVNSVEDMLKLAKEWGNRLVTCQKKNSMPMPGVLANAFVEAAKLLQDAVEAYEKEEVTKCKDLPENVPAAPAKAPRKPRAKK